MTVTAQQIDGAYRAQRARLTATVTAATLRAWAAADRAAAAQAVIPIANAGIRHVVSLVDGYMAAKSTLATGSGTTQGLDASLYTTASLRAGVSAIHVYSRPVGAMIHAANDGAAPEEAAAVGRKLLEKIVRTDLQLAQTHAARDWMGRDERIVGWRRVLTGPSSCELCTKASTRTYRTSDLMPIHEHCDCIVEPVWGAESVASVGTTVRVDDDPEIGPRLMADTWTAVGPRLI